MGSSSRQRPMVTVTSLPPFQARLVAARLGAEGILWQLRGGSQVYPFAPVDVLVGVDEVERACEVLSLAPLEAGEVDQLAESEDAEPPPLVPDRLARGQGTPAAITGGGRRWGAPGWVVWVLVAALVMALCLQVSHVG